MLAVSTKFSLVSGGSAWMAARSSDAAAALSERRVLEERFWRTSKLLRVTVERVGDLGSKFSAALTRSLNRASHLEPGSVYEAMLQLVRSY